MDYCSPTSTGLCTSPLHHISLCMLRKIILSRIRKKSDETRFRKLENLLPAEFFKGLLCRSINCCGITWPPGAQLDRDFLKELRRQEGWVTLQKLVSDTIQPHKTHLPGCLFKCSNHFKHRCATSSPQIVGNTT